ncbi:hypothetical protein [Phenylobacterium sp.]|uniref:hypothetical protein n=1 Tax=Phenylobacterium sp. TaxID=1871053 RepID=UPI003919C57B
MNPTIERLKLIFLAVFAVLVVGVIVWTVGWALPQKKCESQRKWWDPGQRVCAQPVLISDITGRTIQDKQAEAEARAAIGRPAAPAPKQP